jgi:hypothetical protein
MAYSGINKLKRQIGTNPLTISDFLRFFSQRENSSVGVIDLLLSFCNRWRTFASHGDDEETGCPAAEPIANSASVERFAGTAFPLAPFKMM